MEKDFNFSYQLQGISYDYFFIENLKKLLPKISKDIRHPDVELKVNIGGEEHYIWEKNIIQNIVIIKILHFEKDQKYLLAESHTAFDFRITNTEGIPWWRKEKEVPEGLLVTFRSVSYSTTRGMLLSKLSNTYLHNFILPLIDINRLKPQKSKENIKQKNSKE